MRNRIGSKKSLGFRVKVFFLIALCTASILFLPLPIPIRFSEQAVYFPQDSAAPSVNAAFDLWSLRYVLQDEQLKGSVSLESSDTGETLQLNLSGAIFRLKDGVLFTAQSIYSEKENAPVSSYLFFTEDFDIFAICVTGKTYTVSRNPDISADAVFQYFSRYFPEAK